MIEVESLWKSFNGVEALRGIGFSARDGEITGLIGPNGAGKTTTLRILYTVLRPDQGLASVDGFDSTRQRRQVQQRIGVLPDNRGLYPRLTAREHIRYYGRLHGLNGDQLESRIDRLIERLGMEDFCDRRAKGYSKGQTLKVALGRALVHEPHNVMFDEPTNGLDIASSRAVRQLIREIRDQGRCVLFSSHIMQEVEALCDRIVVIAEGRVVADGTPEDLRQSTGRADLEDVFLRAVAVED
ncbi:MAG: ATP-binding cassette domain-containing protein [Alphaproteobacteria bacterium]|nr:ATP-binding cassette domain-containing protein [Alphaproteobacteria bacterium]MDP6563854.1 ATP-binding cassette domain-containing protein [Alphaproteobacteria bacterium]MDP6814421.1 ATP-binding cassette domain-containing protein [Alphaproteobacteria bacterium]